MTEELKQKAECFRKKYKQEIIDNDDFELLDKFDVNVEAGYIAGATENGIQWHDLRKDPNDLPKDCYDVLDEAGYKVFYHHKEGVWKNASGSKIVKVIAWCEIPQFKE